MGFNMGIDYATNIYMKALALLHSLELALQNNLKSLVIKTDCYEIIGMLSNKDLFLSKFN